MIPPTLRCPHGMARAVECAACTYPSLPRRAGPDRHCERCGKALPTVEQMAQLLEQAFEHAHTAVDAMIDKFGVGAASTFERARNVEMLVRSSVRSRAAELRGVCGDCSYRMAADPLSHPPHLHQHIERLYHQKVKPTQAWGIA